MTTAAHAYKTEAMSERWQITYLKEAIKASGLTPSAIARKAGISSTTLTRPLNDPEHKYTIKEETLRAVERATGELVANYRPQSPSLLGFAEDAGAPTASRAATDPRAGLAMPGGTNDMRVNIQDGQLIVNAAVDKKGIEALKKMIEAYEAMLE